MSAKESFFVVINPCFTSVGYSVWRNAELFKHGIFKAAKSNDENVILESYFNDINGLFKDYPPTLVVYKDIPKSLSSKSYLLLQGMIMALCVQNKIYVKLISTVEWIKNLGYKGRKDEGQKIAIKYVKEQYAENLKGVEAEAVCIGSCCIESIKHKMN